MTKKLRVGAFGVGRMGRVHVEHLARRAAAGEIEFVAIGDRYAPTLTKTMQMIPGWGGDDLVGQLVTFDQPDAMAESAALDAVVVASRTADHARDTLVFTRRQLPVMVEKPIANTVSEVADFTETLGEAGGRLVFVALQRHYDAAARAAMAWVSKGYLGHLQQSHHVIQDKNPTPVGYQSGGITADMAIHVIFESMSFHQFELPRYVQALRFNAPHYEDHAEEGANIVHTFLSWADGSLAHLWGSRLNATGYDNGFKLIGTEGRIDVGDFAGDFGEITAKLWRGTGGGEIARGTLSESLSFPMTESAPGHPDFYARYATAYDNELGAFLDHVRQGLPFELGPEVGWKTLLVANLAEKSSQNGGIRIELMLDGNPISTVGQAAELAAKHGVA